MLGSHPRGSGSSPGGGILASLTMSPVQTPVKTSVTTPVNTPAKTQSLAPKPPSESRPTPTKTSVKTPQLCYAPAGREKVCDCRVGRCRIGVSCSLRLSVGRSIRLDGRVSLIGGSPRGSNPQTTNPFHHRRVRLRTCAFLRFRLARPESPFSKGSS